jgi:hypothetical protein
LLLLHNIGYVLLWCDSRRTRSVQQQHWVVVSFQGQKCFNRMSSLRFHLYLSLPPILGWAGAPHGSTCTATCLEGSMAIWARAIVSPCLDASPKASGNCSHPRIT